MNLFEKIKGIEEEDLHSKFKMLRDNLFIEQQIVSNWTKDFVDRDNKIAKEFQTTFHSSFFEFYLNSIFRENNMTLDTTHYAPDFTLKTPFECHIEAVVANIKQGGDSEENRTHEDLTNLFAPPWENSKFSSELDEAIVRYSNAIATKSKKYKKEYVKMPHVSSTAPFIVALASYSQINYGREYIYPLMALLYGLYFDLESKQYIPRKTIKKPDTDADIDIGIFMNPEYNHISAILFTSTLSLGKLTSLAVSEGFPTINKVVALRENCSFDKHKYQLQAVSKENPEYLTDGLFVFHNPNASNPLAENFLEMSTQFFFENEELLILGIETPLISRLNYAPFIIDEQIIMEHIRAYNQKSFNEFYDIIDN